MDVDRVYVPLKEPVVELDDVPVLEARSLDAPTALPGAGEAMTDARPVIVPSFQFEPAGAMVIALNRETGTRAWTARVASDWPPVVGEGVVYVVVGSDVVALEATTGRRLWSVALGKTARAPMLIGGRVLVVLTDPDELIGIRIDERAIAWRRSIAEPGTVRMAIDDRALYAATAAGRLLRVALADGAITWDRTLFNGELGEPSLADDRVLVGTAAVTGGTGTGSRSFFAVDSGSGTVRWDYDFRHLGGHPIGAAADGDVVYMAALDNILRAFNRGNGNQRWKRDIGTRPRYPPHAFGGIVVVTGINPTLTTINARTGAPIGTWSAPANSELQGQPLIDPLLRPLRTSIVVILRDGQVTALRPTAMMFREPVAVPLTALPGRALPIERLPVER